MFLVGTYLTGLYYGRLSVPGKEVISGPEERNPEPRRDGLTQRV